MSEKNLPPTEEKLRKARKKGQLAVSQDIISFFKMLVVIELVFFLESKIRENMILILDVAIKSLTNKEHYLFSLQLETVMAAGMDLLVVIIVLTFAAAATVLFINLLQTKLNFATEVFGESINKMNPANNLKQLFSPQKLTMLSLGPFKIAAVLLAAGVESWSSMSLVLQSDRLDPMILWEAVVMVLKGIFHVALLVMFVLGVLDLGLQRWLTWRSLRMDREEVKKEYKDIEGDPHAKGFRKSTGQEVLMSPAPANKPAVVVVNPEHFAIAIAYEFHVNSIATIAGVGVDADAVNLREMARQKNIPIVRYKSLARQLFAVAKVGKPVPIPMVAAVALVLQAIKNAAETDEVDSESIFEIDEDVAAEILADAPSIPETSNFKQE